MPESDKPASLHVHHDRPVFEWKTRPFDYTLGLIGSLCLLFIVAEFVVVACDAEGVFGTKTDQLVDPAHTDPTDFVIVNVGMMLVVTILAKPAIHEAYRIPFVAMLRLLK